MRVRDSATDMSNKHLLSKNNEKQHKNKYTLRKSPTKNMASEELSNTTSPLKLLAFHRKNLSESKGNVIFDL